ncbi:AMSH/STAMBP protein ubiquitin specific-protease [Thecaphora frezii]
MSPNGSTSNLQGDLATRTRQHTSSRMMKTTRRGRPFTKYFKTYHNSFTTDEAAENLSALKFSQSNRLPDPNEPSRIVTTTTTTTFSMNREMAKGICQHFMDARLIENAGDTTSNIFKDKGVYVLTPKGLHILERFITKNGINGEHLLKVFSSQPICMKLLHLERRLIDDELLINGAVLEVIFRRFAGRSPNYSVDLPTARPSPETPSNFDRTLGVEVHDIQEKVKGQGLKAFRHTFNALAVINWLCDFTTVCGKDESAEIAAHFVRVGLIALISDRSRREQEPYDDRDVIVRVDNGRGNLTEGHFRCHHKTIYGVTDRGRMVARWDQPAGTDSASSFRGTGSHRRRSSDTTESVIGDHAESDAGSHRAKAVDASNKLADIPSSPDPSSTHQDRKVSPKTSASNGIRGDKNGTNGGSTLASIVSQGMADTSSYNSRDSNTNRLKNILEEPALRLLFREFLRQNFCEENLSFWLDVQDFKRRFHTTSSAVAVRGAGASGDGVAHSHKTGMGRKLGRTLTGALGGGQGDKEREAPQHGYTAMERHQQELVNMAFVIFNTYLAPASPSELNIEHNLRSELVAYVNKILADGKAPGATKGSLSPATSTAQLSPSLKEASSSVFGSAAAIRSESSLEEKRATVASQRIRIPLPASQLQNMVRLYDRIQEHIFQLMATDSVPRFIKDARFVQLVRSVEEYTEALEAGRIDPHENSGPAIGRDVVEAMQLQSADMHSTNSTSQDGGSRRSGDTLSRKASATDAPVTAAAEKVASPLLEQSAAAAR